jgi:abortive infection bacteriophage resistance protein
LKKAREHPRQTYNELIENMVSIFIKLKERNQYDEFLHKIQHEKMKELWDNKEDEEWDDA